MSQKQNNMMKKNKKQKKQVCLHHKEYFSPTDDTAITWFPSVLSYCWMGIRKSILSAKID